MIDLHAKQFILMKSADEIIHTRKIQNRQG